MGSETMSNGAASESAVGKDRDPPPAFNGDVDLYKQFERDLKLWRHDTDVPEEEGIKLADEVKGYILYRQSNLSQA